MPASFALHLLLACHADPSSPPGDKGAAEELDQDGDGWPEVDDCQDDDPAIHPGAAEICNDVDDDCDGAVDIDDPDLDPSSGVEVWWDQDFDGYGDPATETFRCETNTRWVDRGGDCDDWDPDIHPGAAEICNDGIDDDCNGLADDDDPGVQAGGLTQAWVDADGDGYGDPSTSREVCLVGSGLSLDDTDCDDTDDSIHPGADEICGDGIDQDCGGEVNSCRIEGTLLYSEATLEILAEEGTPADSLGYRTETVDVDADGNLDLLVAAPQHRVSGSTKGQVHLFRGPLSEGSQRVDSAAATWTGTDSDDWMGKDLRAAGDVDGDGFTDFLIGSPDAAPLGKNDQGIARLVYGGAGHSGEFGATWWGDVLLDNFGSAVSGVGDLDQDGFDDFAIGASDVSTYAEDAGQVYLFYGRASAFSDGWASDADGTIFATHAGSQLGVMGSIAHTDLNGDGFEDVLLGATNPSSGHPGSVFLFLGDGSRLEPSLAVESAADGVWEEYIYQQRFGQGVWADADLDDDGYPELRISEPYLTGYSGALYIYSGGLTGLTGAHPTSEAWLTFSGTGGEYLGEANAAGDLDTDGVIDLAVGAGYHENAGNAHAGAVFLYYGPLSGGVLDNTDADGAILGTDHNQYIGRTDLRIADLDTDGIQDLVVPGWGYEEDGVIQSGGLWVFFGEVE